MSIASRKRQAEREGRLLGEQAIHNDRGTVEDHVMMIAHDCDHAMASARRLAKERQWAVLVFTIHMPSSCLMAIQMVDEALAEKLARQLHLERQAGGAVDTPERPMLKACVSMIYQELKARAFPNAKVVFYSVVHVESSDGTLLYRRFDHRMNAA